MIPHDEELTLSIFSSKFLCKDRIVNSTKYGDVYIDKTKSLYL